MAAPLLLVSVPGMQVLRAETRSYELQPTERPSQRGYHATLLFWFDGAFLDQAKYVLDELTPPVQEHVPVPLVRIDDGSALVQQPVETLGQDVAQLFSSRPVRGSIWVIRLLDNPPGDRGRLQAFIAVQQKEPVFIEDIWKKRSVAFQIDCESAAADERSLLTTSVTVRVTDYRIIRVADIPQAHRIVDVQQSAGFAHVIGVKASHVVVKEKYAGPVKHVTKHERQIAFGAQVGSAREDLIGQFSRGLPFR
jgi:hypothetical protein